MKHSSTPAFTLIEVLITVTICVLLLTLLGNGMSNLRERNRQNICLNNLRQLSSGLSLYIADYDGTYPPAMTAKFVNHDAHGSIFWRTLLTPYLKQDAQLVCPDVETPGEFASHPDDPRTSGYAYNGWLVSERAEKSIITLAGKSEPILLYPSLTISIFDCRVGIVAARRPDIGVRPSEIQGLLTADFRDAIAVQTQGAYRHQGGANYAFSDGHVQWLRPADIHAGKQSDGLHPGFGL